MTQFRSRKDFVSAAFRAESQTRANNVRGLGRFVTLVCLWEFI